jgi:hypothetical protein
VNGAGPGHVVRSGQVSPLRVIAALVLAGSVGCATSSPRQPPGAPPTPETVSREEPGGNASDPHVAALQRLVSAQWGWRNDREDALHVPMPDWEKWRRIRYYGIPTFVGFRYGDAHHAVLAIWLRPADAKEDLEACLSKFEIWATPQAEVFGVTTTAPVTTKTKWARGEVVVRSIEAKVDSILWKRRYAAAYGAYTMWPGTCTVFGVAVLAKGSDELARTVRDRYVHEGFAAMQRQAERMPPF